jgi:CRISPR-associated protein Csx17
MNDIKLEGCRPEPLAHYLKALGVLRLVCEQKDEDARGCWDEDVFWLRTKLSKEELNNFFLFEYKPTPIVAPWNGSSGFYPKDKKLGIDAIANSDASRFADYVSVIKIAKNLVSSFGLSQKPEGDEKPQILLACRNRFPETSIAWLDAAYVLTKNKAKYPPLLGTGGNDGHLEFTNNFMQRLTELFNSNDGEPNNPAATWLSNALYDSPTNGLLDRAIGQFNPGSAGGANATVGFEAKALINPWDYVLMIEGSLVFATASVKRLGRNEAGALSYPFTVKAVGAGYGSAAISDENPRGEIWLPLWSSPAKVSEVLALFSEGRAQVGSRPAANGVDFASSVATLGTDRGLKTFHRYGFHVRFGKNYFATPLGRWEVTPRPEVNLIEEIDTWLRGFRRACQGRNTPARMNRSLRNIEDKIFKLCQAGGKETLQEVLIALGEAESAVALSPRFRNENYLTPIPYLSDGWLRQCDDKSTEFQLAASLASIGMRENMVPVELHTWPDWAKSDNRPPAVVWGIGALSENMFDVLSRRCMDAQRNKLDSLPLSGVCNSSLKEIEDFIYKRVDEERLEQLLRGLSLINWKRVRTPSSTFKAATCLPSAYALLKLCHLPEKLYDVSIPYNANIAQRAWTGNMSAASQLAARRLTGSGFIPLVSTIFEIPEISKRIAASLLIPISNRNIETLASQILKPAQETAKA